MQNCHQIFFRNNVKRIGLGKRCVLPRFRKIQESYGYSTGILRLQYGNLACSYSTGSLQLEYENLTVRLLESQLQYGNLTVTVRETCSYSQGILQIQFGNHTVTVRESCSYRTEILQIHYRKLTVTEQLLLVSSRVRSLLLLRSWVLYFRQFLCHVNIADISCIIQVSVHADVYGLWGALFW